MVSVLYDACLEIWAGSPAVESIPEGLESSAEAGDVTGEVSDPENSILTCSSAQEDDTSPGTSNETTQQTSRRNLIKDKRDSKLTKKLSTDNQLLSLGKEEVTFKRKMIEHMEESERKHQ